MLRGLRLGVPVFELVKRTIRETIDDDCLSIAAQLAYYFALALFPALLFVVALASYLPYNLVTEVVAALEPIAPPDVLSIIRKQLESIVAGEAPNLLTIGILGALWSSSGAMTSIVSANTSKRQAGGVTPHCSSSPQHAGVCAVHQPSQSPPAPADDSPADDSPAVDASSPAAPPAPAPSGAPRRRKGGTPAGREPNPRPRDRS